jgi:undecaprenyl diphosphate synthase
MNNDIVLKVIGRREGLPPEVLFEMDETLRLSATNTGMTLCLAINYGGRTEVVDAVRTVAERVRAGELQPSQIDETVIANSLYTYGMPDPDLLIRTAGEKRISNFLLWQVSYAELWTADVCWPEFTVQHLHQALLDFAGRERRYGGLK